MGMLQVLVPCCTIRCDKLVLDDSLSPATRQAAVFASAGTTLSAEEQKAIMSACRLRRMEKVYGV